MYAFFKEISNDVFVLSQGTGLTAAVDQSIDQLVTPALEYMNNSLKVKVKPMLENSR